MTTAASHPLEAAFRAATEILRSGDTAGAIPRLRAVLADEPLHTGARIHLGIALMREGAREGGLDWFRSAVAVAPDFFPALMNLSRGLEIVGEIGEALTVMDHAAVADPTQERAPADALLLNNLVAAPPATTLTRARAWARRHADPLGGLPPVRDRDPHRPLRVGYLIEHLPTHDFTALPLIEAHGPAMETVVYTLRKPAATDIASRFERAASLLRFAPDIDNDALADLIRRDEIDVLVEGAGFASPGRRLRAVARRPAPVQVHFPVMTTTGMAAIGHAIVDRVLVPPGGDGMFTERLHRAPAAYHFDPLMPTPDPSLPPVVERGRITFGSFNSLSKLRGETLAAWARILERVPDAKLLIKAMDWSVSGESRIHRSLSEEHGLASGRIEIRPPTHLLTGHYQAFGEVDVMLDSFPYGGVTTTAQALWMGVPVVTLAGARVLERYGASLLIGVGLADLVAHSADGYVDTAVRLARDPERLVLLRSRLRAAWLAGPHGDRTAFARGIEAAIRDAWSSWCLSAD